MPDMNIAGLRVQITRFVDECQPGIVSCNFRDAAGTLHEIVDKIPMFTTEDLWSDSIYPRTGTARCLVLERFADSGKDHKVLVTIDKPDHLESVMGQTEFLIFESSLSEEANSN